MLLFDIDGTLLVTGGAGRIAFERAFEELFGIKNAWGDTVPDGKTDPIIIREIADRTIQRKLEEKEYTRLCERYLLYFAEEIIDSPRFHLLPGVPKLLELLAGMEHLILGIVTGNFEGAAWAKLEKGDLKHYFGFGGFGSDSWDRAEITRIALERGRGNRAKQVSKENVFVIGDTPHDVSAAKKLGLKSIAVKTGHTPENELLASRPDYILPDLSDSEKFLSILEN